MRWSFAERFGIVSLLGQSFAAVGTLAYVETRPEEERAQARRKRYAELARTVVTTSTLTAVWLAFDELDAVGSKDASGNAGGGRARARGLRR